MHWPPRDQAGCRRPKPGTRRTEAGRQGVQSNRWIVGALVGTVAGLAAAAYFAGPPAAPQFFPKPPAASTEPPPATFVSDDLSVDSFGAIPRCDDKLAIQTVTALLRSHTFVRIIGLTNVTGFGQEQPGNEECQAEVEIGRGKVAPVRYGIGKSDHHDGWQITVHADAALMQLPTLRP